MVDSSYPKDRDHGREVPEDDPLMELSRIIGFDRPDADKEPHEDAHSDLALDLERELLGTYDSGREEADIRQPIADVPELDSVDDVDEELDFALGDEFAAAFEQELGAVDAGADDTDAAQEAELSELMDVLGDGGSAAKSDSETVADELGALVAADPVQEAAAPDFAEEQEFSEPEPEPRIETDLEPEPEAPAMVAAQSELQAAPHVPAALSLEEELAALLGGSEAPASQVSDVASSDVTPSQEDEASWIDAAASQAGDEALPELVASQEPAAFEPVGESMMRHRSVFGRSTSFGASPFARSEAAASTAEVAAYGPVAPEETSHDPVNAEDADFAAPETEQEPVVVGDLSAFDEATSGIDTAFDDIAPVDEPVSDHSEMTAAEDEHQAVGYEAATVDASLEEPPTAEDMAPAWDNVEFDLTLDELDQIDADNDHPSDDAAAASAIDDDTRPSADTVAFAEDEGHAMGTVDANASVYGSGNGAFAPAIETMQVPEKSVEATAPLDLPEVHFAEDEPANAGLSDLESEFAEVFATLEADQMPAYGGQTTASQDNAQDEFYARAYHHVDAKPSSDEGGIGAASVGSVAAAAVSYGLRGQSTASGFGKAQEGSIPWNEWRTPSAPADPAAEDDDLDIPPMAQGEQKMHRGRGRGIAIAVIGGIVVLGAAGAYAFLSRGGSSGGAPVVVRADTSPVKVKPGEAGGAAVPNQDKAVYARAEGEQQPMPEQKALVNDTETPVTLPPAIETGKSEARIDPATADNSTAPANDEVLAMKPRRVRTVIVKPDGTIVQPEPEPVTQTASSAPAQPSAAPDAVQSPANQAGTPTIASLASQGAVDSQPPVPATTSPAASQAPGISTTTPPAQAPVAVKTETASAEASTVAAESKPVLPSGSKVPIPVIPPVVPSRPASQPMTVVGTTGGAAAPRVASAGGYAVQIASQPTAEAAQQSYANLARRYSKVLAGRGVDIQQADIPNKGTYYRVRIPAASKDEAVSICTDYKAAGGSCFVTH